MMSGFQYDRQSLLDEIVKLTQDHWAVAKIPLLLSSLGAQLLRRGPFSQTIAPLKLRQFIALSLADKVSVITHPTIAQRVGVIPAGESYTYDLDEPRESTSSQAVRKIKPTLWAAFVKPLDEGQCRYIDLAGWSFKFRDVPNGVPSPFVNGTAVDRALIIDGSSATYDSAKVVESIITWAEASGVDIDHAYLVEREFRYDHPFLAQFQDLSEVDLRRIEIPVDILMRMLRRR